MILQKWAEIIGQASQSIDILKNQDVIRSVLNILQVTKWSSKKKNLILLLLPYSVSFINADRFKLHMMMSYKCQASELPMKCLLESNTLSLDWCYFWMLGQKMHLLMLFFFGLVKTQLLNVNG